MKYFDLTHLFDPNMPLYPGEPRPEINQVGFIDKDGYNDFEIKTGLHVGTHMDAPSHMLKGGKNLSDFPPEYFFGPGHLIKVKGDKIGAELLENKNILKGDIIILMTRLYKKFNSTEYYENFPEITPAFAEKAVKLGVKIIGLDTPSPDREPFTVHKILLKNDILIIENLTNLEPLAGQKKFEIIALPAKFPTEAAPVRVIARII